MPLPKLLRLEEVTAATGLSKSSIYARANSGTFPRYVKIGPRGTRWLESAVVEWIEACARGSYAARAESP